MTTDAVAPRLRRNQCSGRLGSVRAARTVTYDDMRCIGRIAFGRPEWLAECEWSRSVAPWVRRGARRGGINVEIKSCTAMSTRFPTRRSQNIVFLRNKARARACRPPNRQKQATNTPYQTPTSFSRADSDAST